MNQTDDDSSVYSSTYRVTFRTNSESSSVVRTSTVSFETAKNVSRNAKLDQPGPSSHRKVQIKEPLTKGQLQRILEGKPMNAPKTKINEKCRVCDSNEDVGIHLGTPLCVRCDAFFRNCLKDPLRFYLRPCLTRKQKCAITPDSHSCSFCRAKKCLAIGLNRNKFTEKGGGFKTDHSDSVLKPKKIGFIECEELVRLLKKAGHWQKPSKEKQKQINESVKNAIRRGISTKWYSKRWPGIHYPSFLSDGAAVDDNPPILPPSSKVAKTEAPAKKELRPILPKVGETHQQPQVILIQVPANGAAPSAEQISAIVSTISSAGVIGTAAQSGPQQITVTVRQPDLTAHQVGTFLSESFVNILENVNRIRFEQQTPLSEFLDASSNKAKRFLYNSSERPVSEHWQRIEAHINDLLCVLVKFAKMLPDFDNLSGDDQHTLLSGTLLEMLFISSIFFIDEPAKRFYLNSGCVYSLSYLAYVFSGCSGAGDFWRSLFDFCRRLQAFVALQDDERKISYDRLGLILALTLFSPPPAFKIRAEESQKQILAILKSELSDDSRLSSLLECLSCLGSLTSKHKRMVTSVRDDAMISLAIDLHAELLQLPPKRGNMPLSSK